MIESYQQGVLREQWDDNARTYTRWDQAGTMAESRAYTPAENAQAEIRAAAAQLAANGATVRTRIAAALAANAADLTQATTVRDGADTLANTSGTFTTAQASTHIRSLAAAVRTLAQHDIAQIKQLNAIMRLVTEALDTADDTA